MCSASRGWGCLTHNWHGRRRGERKRRERRERGRSNSAESVVAAVWVFAIQWRKTRLTRREGLRVVKLALPRVSRTRPLGAMQAQVLTRVRTRVLTLPSPADDASCSFSFFSFSPVSLLPSLLSFVLPTSCFTSHTPAYPCVSLLLLFVCYTHLQLTCHATKWNTNSSTK